MEFLDNVKEKSKSQGFFLSITTSALIALANKFSSDEIKDTLLFFTPQIAAAAVFLLLEAFSFISDWYADKKSNSQSTKSEALVKKNIEMLNIAKTNGLAGEEISELEKMASDSVSAHMQMNLNKISEINSKEDENVKQKRYMDKAISDKKDDIKNEFSHKEED